VRIHVVNLGIDLNANEPEVLVSFLFVVLRFLSAINVPNQSHRDRFSMLFIQLTFKPSTK